MEHLGLTLQDIEKIISLVKGATVVLLQEGFTDDAEYYESELNKIINK